MVDFQEDDEEDAKLVTTATSFAPASSHVSFSARNDSINQSLDISVSISSMESDGSGRRSTTANPIFAIKESEGEGDIGAFGIRMSSIDKAVGAGEERRIK